MSYSGPVNPSWSYPDIINLAGKSGIHFGVSSTYRPGSTAHGHADYHSMGMAVDFTADKATMDKLAAWFYQLAPYLLEEIHTDDSVAGRGYFVKNGKTEPSSFYASDLSGHYDHVHIAMSKQGVQDAAQHLGVNGIITGVGQPGLIQPQLVGAAQNATQMIQDFAQSLGTWDQVFEKVTGFLSLPNIGMRVMAGFFGVVLMFTGLFLFGASA